MTGTLVVARDIAHAKLQELINEGKELPRYVKDHIIYYGRDYMSGMTDTGAAGPAKTPEGYASGSFGPTTAGRMDSYVGPFMAQGGSFITLAKGNRSKQVGVTLSAVINLQMTLYLGDQGLQGIRWFLPRVNWRSCRHPCTKLH